jgi:hypothetical protein
MCTEPLGVYFAMGGREPELQVISTALWRSYVGDWEIVAGRLYLVSLSGTLADGSDLSLESVFPGFPDRVFAHWYTGTIRVPRGQRLHYLHMGYGSIYERDEMLDFEQGLLQRTWVQHNGDAESDDSKPEGYAAGSMTIFGVPRPMRTTKTDQPTQGDRK